MGEILHKYKNSIIIIKMNAVILVFYFRAKQKAFIQIPASNASRLRGGLRGCPVYVPSCAYTARDLFTISGRSRPTISLTLHTLHLAPLCRYPAHFTELPKVPLFVYHSPALEPI